MSSDVTIRVITPLLEEIDTLTMRCQDYYRDITLLNEKVWSLQTKLNDRPRWESDKLQTIARLVAADNNEFYTKKIQWIKEVRNLTGCGLKEAKDAVDSAAGIKDLRDKLIGEGE
jgi:Ribosomal protein L7/L12 C-terminal domain